MSGSRLLEIASEGWVLALALFRSSRRVIGIIIALIVVTSVIPHVADGAWILLLLDLGVIAYGVRAYRKVRRKELWVESIIEELNG